MSNTGGLIACVMRGEDPGEFERCSVCREMDYKNIHTCPPLWEAVRYEYPSDLDDPGSVRSSGDAEDAAIKYAEAGFSDWDYPSEMVIWVRKSEDDPWEKFNISVESVPSFSALRIFEKE